MFEKIFEEEKAKNIIGITDELKCIYINKLFKNNKSKLVVTNTLYEANKLYKSISNYQKNVYLFPMDDFLTSEALAISPELLYNRLNTIKEILGNKQIIVVTNLMGYLRYLPKKDTFEKSKIKLELNQTIEPSTLIKELFDIGYNKEITLNKTGDIAIRGFVVDIFPSNEQNPIRIEFFGDEITSIRTFDINTQLTIKEIKDIIVFPNAEYINRETPETKYKNIINKEGKNNITTYFNEVETIYINLHEIKNSYKNLLEEMIEYKEQNNDKDFNYMNFFEELYIDAYVLETNHNITNEIYSNYESKTIEPFTNNLELSKQRLVKYLTKNRVIICLSNKYIINNLIDKFGDIAIFTDENNIEVSKINLIIKNIENGFYLNNLMVISENEILNKKCERNNYKSNFKIGSKIKNISKLEIGDFIVHSNHGIGKYLGIKKISKNNLEKDYIELLYKNDDKLYIPVEKIDTIFKYSSKEGMTPPLNNLNGVEWQKTKLKTKKRIEEMTMELLDLYAKREAAIGFQFLKDDENQVLFESQFRYKETPDQNRVINEIKEDMQKSRPMDRLLCGDVGYGKTEVAFRAIMKAILSNKQAAILCPTTILSKQHFDNAIERFKTFPINISVINRFLKTKELNKEIDKIKEGKVDLIIGTHRILSDDIKFKDLGLLVIDEEQRFGVKHKEKIKQLKNNIDVLTLSATPIPRTLQMSMTGVRNLSLIETPPVNKLPISTYVMAENNQIIKDAINKELIRNGQVFILYNRIEDIESKRQEIKNLVPEAKIAIAHGKLTKEKLEEIMFEFINHHYDVLLCTTIIETGIDIPRANTLIIYDADRFGLSQLYQIRGRVGRSNRIAYCYLMYDKRKILSEIATKRLNVIKDFTQLGSGFAIAMRDMSLRGAGDILGQQQAGFIDSIGTELFLKMLNEEIQRQKGIEIKEDENILPLIDVSTSISDDYVMESELKIEIHKLINQINDKESLEFIKEQIEDRFGKISDDMIIYMHQEWFEKLSKDIKIEKVSQNKNSVEITLSIELTKKIDGEKLFMDVMDLSRMFRFSMKFNRLIITLDTIKLDKHFIYYLINLVKIIKNSIN
ncbi:MAG: transcription-repair coupling factor [Mycoplasmatota bacterium]